MNEIDELRTQVAELTARLDSVEAKRQRSAIKQRLAMGFAAVAALAIVGAGRVSSAVSSSVLNCTSLNIVDDTGRALLSLGRDENGGAISINDAAGANRIRAAVGAIDQGEVVVSGKTDTRRFVVSADNDGGLIRVCGNDGQMRTLIACQTGGVNAGLINIRDAKARQRVNIGSDNNGGVVTVGVDDETLLSRLGTDKRGGNFYLYGLDHRAHVVMATGEGGIGLINTRGGDGLNRVVLGYDQAGGQVIVNGSDAKPRAGLVVGDDGIGALSLFDKTGQLFVPAKPVSNTLLPDAPPVPVAAPTTPAPASPAATTPAAPPVAPGGATKK
ncbi:MAG TPA: hypothetical protein VGK19_12575 [Capsulimonadaceae bacterium]